MTKSTDQDGQPQPLADKIEPPSNTDELWSNLNKARTALRRAVCLSVTYDGRPRVVEVHIVGISRAGLASIGTYQVDGDTGEEPTKNWLVMRVDECFDVALSQRRSEAPRAGYRKGCKGFLRIDDEV